MKELQDAVAAVNQAAKDFWNYLAKALGAKIEDEPICSDHPSLHMIDGELKLGDVSVVSLPETPTKEN